MENKQQLTIDEIIRIDPRIGTILDGIKVNRRSPKRRSLYSPVKMQLSELVGYSAEHPGLRNAQAYDIVMDIVIEKLNLA